MDNIMGNIMDHCHCPTRMKGGNAVPYELRKINDSVIHRKGIGWLDIYHDNNNKLWTYWEGGGYGSKLLDSNFAHIDILEYMKPKNPHNPDIFSEMFFGKPERCEPVSEFSDNKDNVN